MVDLKAITGKEAHERAVKKRLKLDRKKAHKVKEVEEKVEQKEKERLKKTNEMANRRAEEDSRSYCCGRDDTRAASALDTRFQLNALPS